MTQQTDFLVLRMLPGSGHNSSKSLMNCSGSKSEFNRQQGLTLLSWFNVAAGN